LRERIIKVRVWITYEISCGCEHLVFFLQKSIIHEKIYPHTSRNSVDEALRFFSSMIVGVDRSCDI